MLSHGYKNMASEIADLRSHPVVSSPFTVFSSSPCTQTVGWGKTVTWAEQMDLVTAEDWCGMWEVGMCVWCVMCMLGMSNSPPSEPEDTHRWGGWWGGGGHKGGRPHWDREVDMRREYWHGRQHEKLHFSAARKVKRKKSSMRLFEADFFNNSTCKLFYQVSFNSHLFGNS